MLKFKYNVFEIQMSYIALVLLVHGCEKLYINTEGILLNFKITR
jgi:hypothetical protein